MHFPKPQLLLLVLILIVGSVWYLEDRKVDSGGVATGDTAIQVTRMTPEEKSGVYEVAHEISTPDAFVNVEPSPVDGQVSISIMDEVNRGNVVLVDFWTYSCINCQRTLPFLNAWHEKYADQGLTIIGVHTPEFEFEQELENVARAVEEFGIAYPVVLDNDYSTWRSYNNRYWPRKYLVDIDGFIVYDHIGEGAYEETEQKIVELLEERAERLDLDEVVEAGATPEGVDEVDRSQPRTPEIYFGHSRLEAIANLPNENCFDSVCDFTLPMLLPLHGFALGGSWSLGEEQAVLESDAGTIELRFVANKVNIVAEGTNGEVTAEVLLDGKPIGEYAGSDVENGMVTFSAPNLYNLVDLSGDYGLPVRGTQTGEHTLEIEFDNASEFSAFTFTFG